MYKTLEQLEQRDKRFKELEESLRKFTLMSKKDILFKLAQISPVDLQRTYKKSGELRLKKSIKISVRKKDQEITGIRYQFATHGVYLEHGVGNKREKGSKIAEATKKPWLSVHLQKATEDLTELLAEKYADLLADEIRVLVPGIIDTKITK